MLLRGSPGCLLVGAQCLAQFIIKSMEQLGLCKVFLKSEAFALKIGQTLCIRPVL
jgi:hypothetical protein